MRKLVLTVLLAVSFTGLFAQKLDDVREKIEKGKFSEAKEKIDKVLADQKNQSNSEAWYLKARTYYGLSKTDPSALPEALNALKKYSELEQPKPENQRFIMAMMDNNNSTLIGIYTDFANNARKDFQEQDYENALTGFKNAIDAYDLLAKNKVINTNLDTLNVLLAGFSAQNAKKYDDAVAYYQQLIDAKINDTTYVDAYRFMINYNLETKKDTAAAMQYLELSENTFPVYEDLWIEYEMVAMGNDRSRKLQRYEALSQKYPNNLIVAINHGVELLNHTFFSENKPADYAAQQEATRKALERALSLDPNSIHANYIMSQFYVNQLIDVEDSLRAFKGTTAADQAKRKEMNSRLDSKYENMFKYSQKAYDLMSANEASLRGQDKANYRRVINQLIDYYNRKKQDDKVSFYSDKLKQLK